MKFKAPTTIQRQWRERVRDLGSVISGRNLCQIHHPAGRTAKQNKLPIGGWYILPMTPEEHSLVDMGSAGLSQLKDLWFINHLHCRWTDVPDMTLHEFEKFLFREMLNPLANVPFDRDIDEAIQQWKR